MKDLIISIATSDAVTGLVVMVAGWVLAKLYAKMPRFESFMSKYKGEIIRVVKIVEHEIPDGSPNKGVRRLDIALQQLIRFIESAEQRRLSSKEVAVVRAAISEVHNEIMPPEMWQ